MKSLVHAAREGFASLPIDPAFQRAALQHLERWLSDPETADCVPMIGALIERERWELLLDSFYQVIPFGTGGRRGPVGIGPNRINPHTVASSIQGHALYLKEKLGDQDLRVVIAYDVRRYKDARGLYPADVSNPVLGLSSRDFAELAAGVYVANGVGVHILPRGSGTYVSTPELSFAIRHLGAQGGLNVSASHNPADDNGAKIYDHRGGQQVPPNDEELVDMVARVTTIHRMSWEQACATGQVQFIQPELHQAYLDMNLDCSLQPDARSTHVVFTALHGTGDTTVAQLLSAAGFRVDLEPTQASHDGDFPNVPFGIPNPEVSASMDRAVDLAKELGADLVMSCDPDADRLGVVARRGDRFRFLTGNEMAALVVRYALTQRPARGRAPVVMKTEVTSSLVSRVAANAGAQVVDNLLVGFKYIADGIRQLEETGGFQHLSGGLEDFAVGCEESHGLLVTTDVRDKDAAGAALLLAEATHLQKQAGRDLVSLLEDCWNDVGYVANTLISTVMRGAAGRERIEGIQRSFRESPPTEVGGLKVTAFHDRRDPNGPFGPIRSGTDNASRNVLVFQLGPDARVILRPSGTEPKNKVYAELAGTPGAPLEQEQPRVDQACRALAEAFVQLMLKRADIVLPNWALKISDLLPVEQKQRFADVLLPELLQRLEGAADPDAWLQEQLVPYGNGGRRLLSPAVQAFLQQESCSESGRDGLRRLFDLRG